MGVGPWQLVFIVLLIVVFFGGRRLGEIGRGLGEGVRAFRKSMKDSGRAPRLDEDDDEEEDDEPQKRVRPREPGVSNRRHVMAKRRTTDEDDERS
ncbi:MAG: twin-arginine translocase TatA/TatE family subunit [Polyangiaceae bacterium]|nr:twin-arginine translocase TatA/TatE family subunit [Polyangiaceae bacterium]